MKVTKDMIVSLAYTLREENENGDVLEEVTDNKPLKFLCGSMQLLPKFEENLEGFTTGDAFSFTLSPNEAYGEINKDAVVSLSKDIFVVDGVLREDLLQIGNTVPMRDNNGTPLNGRIVKIDAEKVTIDFNEPLAGKSLFFEGKILDIKEATEKELEQGYPEGMGGGCGDGCSCNGSDGGCDSGSCSSGDDSCGCGSGGCGSH